MTDRGPIDREQLRGAGEARLRSRAGVVIQANVTVESADEQIGQSVAVPVGHINSGVAVGLELQRLAARPGQRFPAIEDRRGRRALVPVESNLVIGVGDHQVLHAVAMPGHIQEADARITRARLKIGSAILHLDAGGELRRRRGSGIQKEPDVPIPAADQQVQVPGAGPVHEARRGMTADVDRHAGGLKRHRRLERQRAIRRVNRRSSRCLRQSVISRSNHRRGAAHGGHFCYHDGREQGRGGSDGGYEPCAPLTVGRMHKDSSFPQQERGAARPCDGEALVSRTSVFGGSNLEDDCCARGGLKP